MARLNSGTISKRTVEGPLGRPRPEMPVGEYHM